MKKLSYCLVMSITFLAACTWASGTTISGTVTGVLTKSASPYQVTGNLLLPAGGTLTIEEGVTLDFLGHYYLEVDGQITAVGTATNPILFTAEDHTNGWAGTRIVGSLASNVFTYAIFEYGRAMGGYASPWHGPDMEGAGLDVERGNVWIQNCTFRYNKSTEHGSALAVYDCANAVVRDSTFMWNETTASFAGWGSVWFVGGVSTPLQWMEVSRCEIAYNISADDAGGMSFQILSGDNSKGLVANNIIHDNSCRGKNGPTTYSIGYFDAARVVNNTFYGNVLLSGSMPTRYEFHLGYSSIFCNNIAWANTGYDIMFDLTGGGASVIQYDDLQGGYAGTGNINSDPMFVNVSSNDFSLILGSACIDTGSTNVTALPATDFLGHPRVSGSSVDMGAFEYDIPSTVIFAVAGNPGNYGTPLPYDYGIHEVLAGTVISNFVSSPVPDVSGTRYTCTGWTGTGNVPASGSGTNIVVTVNTNSTLTWQWLTEYFLDTTNGPYGSIDTGDGWYSNGAPVVITATPDYGYHLLTWSGDVPVGMEGNNPLAVTMDRPRTITAVFATNTGGRVTSMISASSDDAEQWYDGTVQLVSHDLELTYNVKTDKLDQVVGLRFNGITVPQGATVRSAYIQFTARIDESDPCSVTVQVQQADSAETFIDVTNDVSSRSVTTTSVRWDPANWIGDEAGSPERTPDLKDLVQEVVNRGGWTEGNSLAFILRGAGTRTAMSYDGDVTRAPVLLLEWGWGAFAVPMLTNSEVANVSSTSATLTGDLVSDGGATTAAWIYWGTSDGGTNRLAWANSISMGTVSEGTFSADVVGLTPNTVYYFRAYAMNSVGAAWAPSTVPFATLTGGDVTNGLVLYWKFDEGSGTVAADSSGSGNTGTLVNQDASSWVAGRFGSAVSFNGWNQYVFDTNLVNAISGDMTLSCWVKFPNTSGTALDLTDSASPGLQVREDGTLGRLGWVNSGGPSTSLYTTWSLHLDGQWHHVAYVRQGTNYSMYVDDRYVGSSGGTVVAFKRLLAGKNSSDTYWVGNMDDLRIYNRALSWGEVGSIKAGEGVGPVDADGDGMADVWEIQYFGSTNAVNGANGFDLDGDGYSNLQEYILGTDPTLASSTFKLSMTFNGGNEIVSYPTIAASGAAYYGKTRYYDLQSSANVVTGAWANVSGAANVVGNNAVVTYTNLFPERYRFFRVKVRLQ